MKDRTITARAINARQFRVGAYRAELALIRTRNAAYINHMLAKRERKLLKMISNNIESV